MALPVETTGPPAEVGAAAAEAAIKPGQVLPDVPDHIRGLMLPPQSGGKAMEKALDEVDSRFNLEEVAKKKEKVTGAQAFSDGTRKR